MHNEHCEWCGNPDTYPGDTYCSKTCWQEAMKEARQLARTGGTR